MVCRLIAALLLALTTAAHSNFVDQEASALVQKTVRRSSQPGESKRKARNKRLAKHDAEENKRQTQMTLQQEEEQARFEANARDKEVAALETAKAETDKKAARMTEQERAKAEKEQAKKEKEEQKKREKELKTAEHLKNEEVKRKVKDLEREELQRKKEEAEEQERRVMGRRN